MDPPKLKTLLVQKLSWFYDGKVHSLTDLNMREEVASKGILEMLSYNWRPMTVSLGSLCGMAAIYQAAQQTILTISEIKQMSYNDVKIKMGEMMLMDSSTSRSSPDETLLNDFYRGK